ncbi:unnamed protein product [Tuber aestivum]|uniref:Uncharacterized protein n=1 Tax=Tuber aestivum TaxID=59557 RepID=A0A292Q202_9PEZI|nr:unnamed protein product [Tuber aestivum]
MVIEVGITAPARLSLGMAFLARLAEANIKSRLLNQQDFIQTVTTKMDYKGMSFLNFHKSPLLLLQAKVQAAKQPE